MKSNNHKETKSAKDFNRNKSRSKTKFRNKRSKDDSYDERGSYAATSNPFEWYNKYPLLIEAAGRIPFPNRPGMDIKMFTQSGTDKYTPIPGVLAVHYVPTVGVSKDNTSPISQVAKELYGQVRKSFSAELAVEPADLVMYMLALDSIFSNIAFMKRVYRTVNTYSPENYAIPEQVLMAMGFTQANIQSLRTNWIQGWGLINQLIQMTRKFFCPAIFDLFNRHYWMNDRAYADANTINSQIYMFVPDLYYEFSETASEQGTSLVAQDMSSFIGDWNTMYAGVKEQIDVLSASSDGYTISGYLMRAFDGTPSFVVEDLGQDEKLTVAYEPIVLTQIENSKAIPINTATCNITQDPNTNAILSNPVVVASQLPAGVVFNTLLNIRSDMPTVPDIVEATRLSAGVKVLGESKFEPICASEIVTGYIIWRSSGGTIGSELTMTTFGNVSTASVTNLALLVEALGQLVKFDWHPAIYVNSGSTTAAADHKWTIFQDFYNVTTIENNTLEALHRMCLYSELNAFSIMH